MKNDLKPQLEWDIQVENVEISRAFETGKLALFRNDTDKLLGLVSKKYNPISNQQFMNFANRLAHTGEFELQGFTELKGGKIVVAFLKNSNPKLTINGFPNEEYLFIGNSFDGSKPFHIGTASSLVRCENQFTSTLKVFSQKHLSLVHMDDTMIRDVLEGYKKQSLLLYGSFDGMHEVLVDEAAIEDFMNQVKALLSKPDEKTNGEMKSWTAYPRLLSLRRAIDREMNDLGRNAFGLFNGVTYYTTHNLKTINQLGSQLNGTAKMMNELALRYCNQLKEKNLITHN